MTLKFSFLMAVNRDNEFLEFAISSVLNQSRSDFNFYIIANNCSDELWRKLEKYTDSRIRLVRVSVGQLSHALNVGLDLIKNGYVLRMDSDDISLPDRLEVTAEFLRNSGYPDIVGGGAIVINKSGSEMSVVKPLLIHEEIVGQLWRRNPLIHPSCAINVETILTLRGYSGGFMSEDYDLWLRASRNSQVKFSAIDRPLIKYRIHEEQARGNRLGYAEGAGYQLREFLLGRGSKFLVGAAITCAKVLFKKIEAKFVLRRNF